MDRLQSLMHEPQLMVAAGFALLWLLAAWRAFRTEFSAKQWALKPERHKAIKALAYAGALPFRVVFSIFMGLVEALVWSLLLGFAYLLFRAMN